MLARELTSSNKKYLWLLYLVLETDLDVSSSVPIPTKKNMLIFSFPQLRVLDWLGLWMKGPLLMCLFTLVRNHAFKRETADKSRHLVLV